MCIIINKEEFIVRYITERSEIMNDTKRMSIAILQLKIKKRKKIQTSICEVFFSVILAEQTHYIQPVECYSLIKRNELFSNSSLLLVQLSSIILI